MNQLKKTTPLVVVGDCTLDIGRLLSLPAIYRGYILAQHDAVAGIGAGREASDTMKSMVRLPDGQTHLLAVCRLISWLRGMGQIMHLNFVQEIYGVLFYYAGYIFIMLLVFTSCFSAFKNFKVWLLFWEPILVFSSYFFIIISIYLEVCNALLYSPTIAGMVLIYRGKYLWGGLLTALFVAYNNCQPCAVKYITFCCSVAVHCNSLWCFAVKETFSAILEIDWSCIYPGILGICVNLIYIHAFL